MVARHKVLRPLKRLPGHYTYTYFLPIPSPDAATLSTRSELTTKFSSFPVDLFSISPPTSMYARQNDFFRQQEIRLENRKPPFRTNAIWAKMFILYIMYASHWFQLVPTPLATARGTVSHYEQKRTWKFESNVTVYWVQHKGVLSISTLQNSLTSSYSFQFSKEFHCICQSSAKKRKENKNIEVIVIITWS